MIDYTWTAIGLYMDSTWTLCGFYKDHTKTLQDIPSPYNLFIYFAFIQYHYYSSILYIHNNESGGPACLFGEWEKSRGSWSLCPSPPFLLVWRAGGASHRRVVIAVVWVTWREGG